MVLMRNVSVAGRCPGAGDRREVHDCLGASKRVVALPGIGEVRHKTFAGLAAVAGPVDVQDVIAAVAQVLDGPASGLA